MKPLPEPTRRQALAHLVGLGTFWGGWLIAVLTLEHGVDIGVIPFAVAFVAGLWFFFGGAFPLLARAEGRSIFRTVLFPPPAVAWRVNLKLWQFPLPSSWRRAARVLGWNERVVVATLGCLLAAAVAV